jgi:hypothetical protein
LRTFELRGGPTAGADFNLNVNTIDWGELLDHYTIDDNHVVMGNITIGTPAASNYGTHAGLIQKVRR